MEQREVLPQRILRHYDDMPRGERRLADLLLENPFAVVEHSATALAQRANISKATAARFFQRLGYPSFKAAQRQERANATERPDGADPLQASALGAAPPELSVHLQSDIQNLVRTVEQQRSDELNQAIRILARGEKLWVVGFGANYPLAHIARALLIRIRPDIRMIPIGGFSVPEEFASISPTDAMLAFGIGRKTRSLRDIMRSAMSADMEVVYVTDQISRSGPSFATVTLRCRTQGAGLFDSMASPVSLMTYICSALVAKLGVPAVERLRAIESIHSDWGDLVVGDI